MTFGRARLEGCRRRGSVLAYDGRKLGQGAHRIKTQRAGPSEVPQGRPIIAHRFNGGFSAPENSPSPEGRKKASATPGVVRGQPYGVPASAGEAFELPPAFGIIQLSVQAGVLPPKGEWHVVKLVSG